MEAILAGRDEFANRAEFHPRQRITRRNGMSDEQHHSFPDLMPADTAATTDTAARS
jgi:hypothetical protein